MKLEIEFPEPSGRMDPGVMGRCEGLIGAYQMQDVRTESAPDTSDTCLVSVNHTRRSRVLYPLLYIIIGRGSDVEYKRYLPDYLPQGLEGPWGFRRR